MGKSAPEPPPPPDPYATARAQTGSNVTTSIANTTMANANVKGPLGTTTYNQIGSRKISEPVLDKDGKPVTKRVWQGDPTANPGMTQGGWVTTGYGEGGREEGYYGDATYSTGDPTKGKWVDETEMVNYDVPIWEQINQLSENQAKLLSQQENLGMGLNDLASSQIKRIGGVLNTPMDGSGLPPGAAEMLAANGGMIDRADFMSGGIPRANFMGNQPTAPTLRTQAGLERLQGGFGNTGQGVQYVGDLGSAQSGFGGTGQGIDYLGNDAMNRATGFMGGTQQGVQYAPNLDMGATDYANVGGPARSTGDFGFQIERQRVEDAIRQRQQPELDRQRAALENQLVNQGFTRGTQGFNAQMDEQLRRENDANLAAIMAGGQEQTRMGQLALGRFGAENAAQAQADEQARARGLFGLGATAQNNQARLAMQQASNAAQQQEFGQGADRSRLFNEAAAQNNAGSLAFNAARNAAQQQDFGQQQARGTFANEALAMNQQARLNEAASRNAAQQQDFGQQMSRGMFANEATTGNNQFALSGMDAENAARQAQFNMAMSGEQLRDSRLGNQFQADMAGAQLGDSRAARQYEADMNRLSAQQALRQQGLQEQMALRNQPINEIAALMSGGQVTMPQFSQFRPSAMSETPVGDYVYKSADIEAANYRAQAAAQAQSMGGLFGMGGQLLGGLFAKSDRRVKTDIERIGTLPNGLPVYAYRYKGQADFQIGVMAQEVEKLIPWAVVEIDGIKHVNYAAAVV